MPDLSTSYLGLALTSPIVASSSPLTERLESLRVLEDSGVGAVVMPSLFEEQLTLESTDLDTYLSHGADSHSEALSYFPDMWAYNLGPEGYLTRLAEAKKLLKVPVIASLNGVSVGGWIAYAKRMEEAGADALELNVYYVPTDPAQDGGAVERQQSDLVQAVVESLKIPVAVKLTPFLSAPANVAAQLAKAGAKGVVLFNRFYQPDLDLDELTVVPALDLSTPSTLRIRLRWAAIMHGHIDTDLAISGGVHSATDVLKCMMVGAKVAMMASATLRHGPGHVRKVLADLETWMQVHDYDSIQLMQGSMSRRACAEPAAWERANYMKVLRSYALRGG